MSGTYSDHLTDIAGEGVKLSSMVDLEISDSEIEKAFTISGFSGYRLRGATIRIKRTYNAQNDLVPPCPESFHFSPKCTPLTLKMHTLFLKKCIPLCKRTFFLIHKQITRGMQSYQYYGHST